MSKIFISYRRDDSGFIAGRIREHLIDTFGQEDIFFDVDNIPLGLDFRYVVKETLSNIRVLLAIIGPKWVNSINENNTNDFVRIEIETALQMGIPVIPVLIGSVQIPESKQLPQSLTELVFRNAARVRPDPDFENDMRRLIHSLSQDEMKVKITTSTDINSGSCFLDKFIQPFSEITLGKTSKEKWLSFANLYKIDEKKFLSFTESILTEYHIWHNDAEKLVDGVLRINFQNYYVSNLIHDLFAYNYKIIIRPPYKERTSDWWDFDFDRGYLKLIITGCRPIGYGKQILVEGTFLDFDRNQYNLLNTNCLNTISATII
jgi:hypothetical protein